MSEIYRQEVLPFQERQYPELAKRLREVAKRLAQTKGEITSDDVHEAHPIPPGIDGRIMGAVFSKKEWVRVGYQPSRRKDQNHGRVVSRWRLREMVPA